VSFYVSTATFFLLHCDEWDRVVALPRHKFVTGATLLQLESDGSKKTNHNMIYLHVYDACDQISDFCHQQLLRKMR
jgi:hypothetical protein